MNNYHFFGCSWTGWSNNNYVQELAKIKPEHNFYNWGILGSSIHISTFVLDYVKQKFSSLNNYFVFQVTTLSRVTWWDEKYKKYLIPEQVTDNYYRLGHGANEEFLGSFSAASCPNKHARKYKEEYFKWTSYSTMAHNHKMHCHYAKQNSDFMFFQKPDARHKEFKDHLIVQDVLGEKRYQELCDQEDKHHFGLEGAQWQAKWISKVTSECLGKEI